MEITVETTVTFDRADGDRSIITERVTDHRGDNHRREAAEAAQLIDVVKDTVLDRMGGQKEVDRALSPPAIPQARDTGKDREQIIYMLNSWIRVGDTNTREPGTVKVFTGAIRGILRVLGEQEESHED